MAKSTSSRKNQENSKLVEMARKQGALAAVVVSPADVATGSWVRWKCQFGCGGYGSSRMCPPHTPTPAETRRVLDDYRRAVLFEAPPGDAKRIAAGLERELFLDGNYKAFGLGSGPCRLCDECDLHGLCRTLARRRPSI